MSRVRVRRPLLALVVLVVVLAVGYGVRAARSGDSGGHSTPTSSTSASSATASPVAMSALPPAVAETVHLIERGGPYPYPANDGVVFHNDEHLLPRQPDGYYHEYTVPTPGADDRGADRVVTGRGGQYYYTGDHYVSFVRLDPSR